MAGKVIGKTLSYGYRGNISRVSDSVVMAYPAKGRIEFGAPVVLNDDNTVSPVTAAATEPRIIGFAVREVMQPKENNMEGWYYEEGDTVDVMVRGTMTVEVVGDAAPTAMGAVYVRKATGEIVAAEENSGEVSTLKLTNAIFPTGKKDADGIAEITLTERKI